MMCMIETGDFDSNGFGQIITRTARKQHKCAECRRFIQPGETYDQISIRYDGAFSRYRNCAHCSAAVTWLNVTCRGYLYNGALEDLEEHWHEEPDFRSFHLGRLIVGMRNGWRVGRDPIKLVRVPRVWTHADLFYAKGDRHDPRDR